METDYQLWTEEMPMLKALKVMENKGVPDIMMEGTGMRIRKDKSTRYFVEIKNVSKEGKKWKKTDAWQEQWF